MSNEFANLMSAVKEMHAPVPADLPVKVSPAEWQFSGRLRLATCAKAWVDAGCPGPGEPRWTPREVADRLMQRGLMLIYEDRAEVVDIETALTEIMGKEG